MPLAMLVKRSYSACIGSKQPLKAPQETTMNTSFHTATPAANKTARPLAFVMAVVATVVMLQSIDVLASREQGESIMARAATTLVAAVRRV
jgi:hypothetical protein